MSRVTLLLKNIRKDRIGLNIVKRETKEINS